MSVLWMRSALLLVVTALSARSAAAVDMHCNDRDGRCMAVTINGQKAVKLTKSTKQFLASMRRPPYEVDKIRYELTAPTGSKLDVSVDPSADSKGWFGEGLSFAIGVLPLAHVKLQPNKALRTDADDNRVVAAPESLESLLVEGRLPPGPYLIVVSLNGDSNWDRMDLFLRVSESALPPN